MLKFSVILRLSPAQIFLIQPLVNIFKSERCGKQKYACAKENIARQFTQKCSATYSWTNKGNYLSLEGLSRVWGNLQARFLGEQRPAMVAAYPTLFLK